MIYVTGGAGFIGSALVWELNRRGHEDILVVDSLGSDERWKNLRGLRFHDCVDKNRFREQILADRVDPEPRAILHLGACSSTTEQDVGYLMDNNTHYTRDLARWALEHDVRFIYASSAATYGDGSQGYEDDETRLEELRPLNPYGFSKHRFDLHARRRGWLKEIVGLKYFNVYGPNEYHKGDMRSVAVKSFHQARETGTVRLFESHRDDCEHGQQKRDFLYVKDAVDITLFFLENPSLGGIYNAGTGEARTFDSLAEALFDALGEPVDVEYFPMPEELRANYQYFTEAETDKLRRAGYRDDPRSLESGIEDYVRHYLSRDNPYLGS